MGAHNFRVDAHPEGSAKIACDNSSSWMRNDFLSGYLWASVTAKTRRLAAVATRRTWGRRRC